MSLQPGVPADITAVESCGVPAQQCVGAWSHYDEEIRDAMPFTAHDRARHARAGLTAVAAALACFHASATDESKTFLTKPLLLEDFGSFYIGGIPKVTDFSATPIPSDTPPDLGNQYWVPIKDIWALRVRLQMQC